MFNRLLTTPVALLALLLAALFTAVPADGRPRLSRDVLNDSRGSSTGGSLFQASCDGKQGNVPCGPGIVSCTTCSTGTYSYPVGAVTNGGYDKGAAGAGSCGTIGAGICNPANACAVNNPNNGPCAAPPGSPTIQSVSYPVQ